MDSLLSHDTSQALVDFVMAVTAGATVPQQKFVLDFLLGLFRGGSVILAQVARALQRPERLIHTEKRLSRNMKSRRLDDDNLRANYLKAIKPHVHSFPGRTVLAVDGTDIAKPRAKKMPYLGHVWDGSAGQAATGYPVLSIASVGPRGGFLPITSTLYSASEPSYVSEADQLRSALTDALELVPNAMLAMDRGYDSHANYAFLARLGANFCVRVKTNSGNKRRRKFWTPEGSLPVDEIHASAEHTEFPVTVMLRDKRRGSRSYRVRYRSGFALPVITRGGNTRAPTHGGHYSLIMCREARSPNTDGLVLFTNERVETQEHAAEILGAYRRRFAIEEFFAVKKQTLGLETLAVQSWTAIRRTCLLAHLAMGFVARMKFQNPRLAGRLADAAPSFGPKPDFAYFRVLEAMSTSLTPESVREAA